MSKAGLTTTSADLPDDRDTRFREIVYAQLGRSGIGLLASQAFLALIGLLIIVLVSVNYLSTYKALRDDRSLNRVALVV